MSRISELNALVMEKYLIEKRIAELEKPEPEQIFIERLNEVYGVYEAIYIMFCNAIEKENFGFLEYIYYTFSNDELKNLREIHSDEEKSVILRMVAKNIDEDLRDFVKKY